MKTYKLLLLLCCASILAACGGDDKNDNDSHDGLLHNYRVEVDFDGDKASYLMQVVLYCYKKYDTTSHIDLTIDGKQSMSEVTGGTYHLKQALTDYPSTIHNFTFSNHHSFETVEKGIMLTVHIAHKTLDIESEDNAGPLTTKVRIYKDDKLIKETEGTAHGYHQPYVFEAETF